MPNAGAPVLAGDFARWKCKAQQATAQSIPTGAFTPLQFNGTDDVDDLGIHDPVTNNSRLVIGLALGWWLLIGTFVTNGSAAAQQRRSRLVLNGATGINGGYSGTPAFTATGISGGFWTSVSATIAQASVSTDYVELQGLQDTAGAINTVISGDLRSSLSAVYLGP